MTDSAYDAVAFVAADRFAVSNAAGDAFVEEFAPGVRVRADCGADGVRLGTVTGAVHDGEDGRTVVTVDMDAGAALTDNLAWALHGNDVPDSLCGHAAQHAAGGRDALAHGALSGVGSRTHDQIDAAIEAMLWSGECRLDYVSPSLLTLSRANGHRLVVDDAARSIPAAGVTLAHTGVANTLYYIYALWTGTAIALEASPTSAGADPRNGIMVKSGDAARTLVGMARTNSSGQWVYSATQRLVASYYNRKSVRASAWLASEFSTASTSPVATANIIECLTWGDAAKLRMTQFGRNTASGSLNRIYAYANGANVLNFHVAVAGASVTTSMFSVADLYVFSPGLVTIQMYVSVDAGVGTFGAGTSVIAEILQ